jgi:hypothetical protein
MKISTLTKAYIILSLFIIVAVVVTPPDVVTQVVFIVEMIIIYGLLTLIISRFKSLKQTPESIKKLIIVMVCLLSITITCSVNFFMQCYRLRIANDDLRTKQSEKADLKPLTK